MSKPRMKEFKQMVEDIRNVENALGDGIKRPTSAEKVIKKCKKINSC